MRILLVTGTYSPTVNGVAISIAGYKRNLTKLGHKVLVIAPDNKAARRERGVVRFPSVDNPFAADYPIPLYPDRKVFASIKQFKPEIVSVHHPFHIGYFARLIAQKYNIPLVFTFHTDYDRYARKYVKLLPKKLSMWFVQNTVYEYCRKVDCIVAPSKFIADRLTQKMPYLETVVLPSPVVGITETKAPKSTLRTELGLPSKAKLLLTVSRLGPEKNLKTLVTSLAALPKEYRLILVGDGPQRATLRRIVQDNGLEDRVVFVGKVPHKLLAKYYTACDYFYFASTTETQGLIFLEAAHFGLPVVTVDSRAAREFVDPKFGVLTPNAPDGLAVGLKQIAKRDKTLLTGAAKQFARGFTEPQFTGKMVSLFEDLIERKLLATKILATGWQSWSVRKDAWLKVPIRNYSPMRDTYLPRLKAPSHLKPAIVGWCSWYGYWHNITESQIAKQCKWFATHSEVSVEYIIVDDGWTRWGEWDRINTKAFPHGHKGLVSTIKSQKLKAGIWLAPFLLEPGSEFAKSHPELLATHNGKLVDGLKVTRFDKYFLPKYILDIRKKKARKWVWEQITGLVDEGYELIKFDFLYAIYFIPGISSKEAGYHLHKLMQKVKNTYPHIYTIACGAPLLPLIGVVDSIRIGPDTVLAYVEKLPLIGRMTNRRRVVSVIENIKHRKWLARFWRLDPDVFVCRPQLQIDHNLLVRLQNAIHALGGNVFLGDDMTGLSQDRLVRYIHPLIPHD